MAKQAIIDWIKNDSRLGVIKSSLRGNSLWVLSQKPGGKAPKILLFRLVGLRASGKWSYTSCKEDEGLSYYDVPLSFLTAAPIPLNEDGIQNSEAANWRAEVVSRHNAKKNKKPLNQRDLVSYGQREFLLINSLGRKGWTVADITNGKTYVMKSKQAAVAVLVTGGLNSGTDFVLAKIKEGLSVEQLTKISKGRQLGLTENEIGTYASVELSTVQMDGAIAGFKAGLNQGEVQLMTDMNYTVQDILDKKTMTEKATSSVEKTDDWELEQ